MRLRRKARRQDGDEGQDEGPRNEVANLPESSRLLGFQSMEAA